MRLVRILNTEVMGVDEDVVTTWALTEEQYHLLLNYAINTLLEQGLVKTTDMTPEELDEIKKEIEVSTKAQFDTDEFDFPTTKDEAKAFADKVKDSFSLVTNNKKDILH